MCFRGNRRGVRVCVCVCVCVDANMHAGGVLDLCFVCIRAYRVRDPILTSQVRNFTFLQFSLILQRHFMARSCCHSIVTCSKIALYFFGDYSLKKWQFCHHLLTLNFTLSTCMSVFFFRSITQMFRNLSFCVPQTKESHKGFNRCNDEFIMTTCSCLGEHMPKNCVNI